MFLKTCYIYTSQVINNRFILCKYKMYFHESGGLLIQKEPQLSHEIHFF